MVAFDEKKYINGVTGRVRITPDSPILEFDLLLFKDGSGIMVELRVPGSKAKLMPVKIDTRMMVATALKTLKIEKLEAESGADEIKGLAS